MLKHLCQQATRLLPARVTSEERRHPIMPDFTISNNGINKLLKNLKPNKAAGPDKLRPLVLRELWEEIAPILEAIFMKSLDTKKLPDDWKSDNVVPIYTKGSKHLPVNWRPVSLTCICSKLMEHIVVSQIGRHPWQTPHPRPQPTWIQKRIVLRNPTHPVCTGAPHQHNPRQASRCYSDGFLEGVW